ncbi:hypothetical protein BC941DRAFT_441649 [Chlamydoabsidia padenii]|nr:hypothetical protein BC941DRAFT_441649 [Chlamydoabsidia padenii]
MVSFGLVKSLLVCTSTSYLWIKWTAFGHSCLTWIHSIQLDQSSPLYQVASFVDKKGLVYHVNSEWELVEETDTI